MGLATVSGEASWEDVMLKEVNRLSRQEASTGNQNSCCFLLPTHYDFVASHNFLSLIYFNIILILQYSCKIKVNAEVHFNRLVTFLD